MDKNIKTPRGIRNNNPLNIKRGKQLWQGMADVQSDPVFVKFKSLEFGLRAAFRLLKTYYERYDGNTIRGIITRWAPPSENDTEAYISFVCKQTGFKHDKRLFPPVMAKDEWIPIVCAMAKYENGLKDFDYNLALQGWKLAFR